MRETREATGREWEARTGEDAGSPGQRAPAAGTRPPAARPLQRGLGLLKPRRTDPGGRSRPPAVTLATALAATANASCHCQLP